MARQAIVAPTSVAAINYGVALAHQNVVAVPLAVPVALPSYVQYHAPVAAVSTAVGYGAPHYGASAAYSSPAASCADGCATATGGPMGQPLNVRSRAEVPSGTDLIAQSCIRCHGPSNAKGGLDLTKPTDAATRLEMVRRLMSDDPQEHMPQGQQLSADELSALVQQIASEPERPAPGPAGQ